MPFGLASVLVPLLGAVVLCAGWCGDTSGAMKGLLGSRHSHNDSTATHAERALGKRVWKSRTPTHSGFTVMRTMLGTIPRSWLTQA
jgi:hypothetical protein